MTYRDALLHAAATFSSSETPFLDAVLLMAHAMGISKEKVLARLSEPLTEIPASFMEWARRRAHGESIAHILGFKEFFGRLFIINDAVLSPRQDTETLVEAALREGDKLAKVRGERLPQALKVLDLCTGSGLSLIHI
ncbi:MAG: peptide chain release factor N(5)-glutamine methyltransferase, partial [Rectinema sp.]|nr:peptide chain release factor N(5)-glutamine methyltransferase [Rectinema sp.]